MRRVGEGMKNPSVLLTITYDLFSFEGRIAFVRYSHSHGKVIFDDHSHEQRHIESLTSMPLALGPSCLDLFTMPYGIKDNTAIGDRLFFPTSLGTWTGRSASTENVNL